MNKENSDKTRNVLAIAALIIIALLIAGLFFVQIPDSAKDLINIALGFVAGYVGAVFNYYFGSSDGSRQKTALLNEQATGRADDPIHVEQGNDDEQR